MIDRLAHIGFVMWVTNSLLFERVVLSQTKKTIKGATGVSMSEVKNRLYSIQIRGVMHLTYLDSDGHKVIASTGLVGDGAPEIDARDFPEAALIEAAHEIQLVSGCYVSLEDYAAAAAVFLRELAKSGFVVSRSPLNALPEDSKGHRLSIESAAHVLLAERCPHAETSTLYSR